MALTLDECFAPPREIFARSGPKKQATTAEWFTRLLDLTELLTTGRATKGPAIGRAEARSLITGDSLASPTGGKSSYFRRIYASRGDPRKWRKEMVVGPHELSSAHPHIDSILKTVPRGLPARTREQDEFPKKLPQVDSFPGQMTRPLHGRLHTPRLISIGFS